MRNLKNIKIFQNLRIKNSRKVVDFFNFLKNFHIKTEKLKHYINTL